MEHHGGEEMDSKEESPQVWADSAEQEQNTAQVTSAFEHVYGDFGWKLHQVSCANHSSEFTDTG